MARVALLGSLALHAIAGAVLLSIGGEISAPRDDASTPIAIDVIAAAPTARPIEAPAGGGSYVSQRAPSSPASQQLGRMWRATPAARTALEAVGTLARAEIVIDGVAWATGGLDLDGDGGDGMGEGGRRGAGIGFGDGARIALVREVPAPPPAPAESKAHPAKLIYPARHRDVDDAELFVARVTVDRDGYVVGARLVRGFGGPRDDMAAQLIFRFRYAPAIDDAGHEIRSTFDQKFLVSR